MVQDELCLFDQVENGVTGPQKYVLQVKCVTDGAYTKNDNVSTTLKTPAQIMNMY
jgi:hypothetical protein